MPNPLDDSWFQELYNLYRGPIFGRCFSLTHNRDDAEDLTHETFLRALADPKFSELPLDHQKNWLFRTARHRCLDRLGHPSYDWDDDEIEKLVHPNPTPEAVVVRDEPILQGLESLSVEERKTAMLWACDYTFKEIGQALGCSTTSAFNYFEKAKTKLKRFI